MSDKTIANQRIMLTKHLIHDALLHMLKTQHITKISIRELCQVAGINRSTFYNHYGSQYDVINEIAQNYLEETSYSVIHSLSEGKSVTACIIQVLKYIKKNRDFAKLIFGQSNYDLASHITQKLPSFDSMIINRLPSELLPSEKKAIATYVQYGSLKLLKDWILDDCSTTPKEEALLLLSIAQKTMHYDTN